MNKFKVGDIVEFIENKYSYSDFTIGKKYEVKYAYKDSYYVIIIDDTGEDRCVMTNSFKLAEKMEHSLDTFRYSCKCKLPHLFDEQEEKHEFKVGDFVECVNNRHFQNILTSGKKYEINGISPELIRIINDDGNWAWFCTSRFKLVEQKEEIKHKFKVGDLVKIKKECPSYINEYNDKVFKIIEVDFQFSIKIENDEESWWIDGVYLYLINNEKEEPTHNGELDKTEEFDATRLGFYKSRDGGVWRVVHVLDDKYKHEEPVIAIDNEGYNSSFKKNGSFYQDETTSAHDLVEYLGPELPVKKEPRKLEFKASLLEETYGEFNNNYAVDSALKAECGSLMNHDYLYKDVGLFEKISKWKVTMEEILE